VPLVTLTCTAQYCNMRSMNDGSTTTLGIQLVESRIGRPLAEYLRDEYLVAEKPQADIAAELGVNVSTVSRWMARYAIPTRVVGRRNRRRPAA